MSEVTTEQMMFSAITAHTAILSTLAYWAVSTGWAWYVAVQKNRWWFEGFLMGASLGPFGVIAAACMPTLEPRSLSVPDVRDEDRFRKRYTDAEWRQHLDKLPKPLAN